MSYSDIEIQRIWEKARIIEGYDCDKFRKDACDAWIARNEFGNRNNMYGWEIDHVYPASRGGEDHIVNLRPMQWQNNLSKGNDYPSYMSVIQSEGNKNVMSDKQLTVNDKLKEELSRLYNI